MSWNEWKILGLVCFCMFRSKSWSSWIATRRKVNQSGIFSFHFWTFFFYSPLQYGDASIPRLPWVYVSFSWTYPNVSCHVEYVTAGWSEPAARNANEYINTYGPVWTQMFIVFPPRLVCWHAARTYNIFDVQRVLECACECAWVCPSSVLIRIGSVRIKSLHTAPDAMFPRPVGFISGGLVKHTAELWH